MRREKIMDVDASSVGVLLAGFRSWLVAERGLSPETVRCYCNQASTSLVCCPALNVQTMASSSVPMIGAWERPRSAL